jgi:hypothetical protein
MPAKARYAIITPYYKESRTLLERCIKSVLGQSVSTDHFLVADGHPQAWIDNAGVRHFKLDRSHGDFGNTPRGVGALIAIAEQYIGIGLLDADNWLERDHVEACLLAAQSLAVPCDYVIARRMFRRPDETIMHIPEEDGHVDTSCLFLLRGSFSVLPHWAMMPPNLALLGDRYFYAAMQRQPFTSAQVARPTVNYLCLWASLYRMIGEVPPPDAHENHDLGKTETWLRALDARDLEVTDRLIGVPYVPGETPALPNVVNYPSHVA